MTTGTYLGKVCVKCGDNKRYASDNRCVNCRLSSNRTGRKLRKTTPDNRLGLASGFVQFGTIAHHILQIALAERFVSIRVIRFQLMMRIGQDKVPSTGAVSAQLHRLVAYRFLYKVGKDRIEGTRSFAIFALTRYSGNGFDKLEKLTTLERTQRYRERKKVKVSSVFNWRGTSCVTSTI